MADNQSIRQGKSWDLRSGPLQFTESSGHWAQLGSPDWEALPSPSHAVSRSAQMLQKQSTADTRMILVMSLVTDLALSAAWCSALTVDHSSALMATSNLNRIQHTAAASHAAQAQGVYVVEEEAVADHRARAAAPQEANGDHREADRRAGRLLGGSYVGGGEEDQVQVHRARLHDVAQVPILHRAGGRRFAAGDGQDGHGQHGAW